MKLTKKEFIRFQKELHLLEHDFYEIEIKEWSETLNNKKGLRILTREEEKIFEEVVKELYSFNIHQKIFFIPFFKTATRRVWFRHKFPEFFKEDK